MENGYIKLHRCIEDSVCFADPDALKVWIYLLIHANYKDRQVMFNKQIVELRAGQFISGRKSIAEKTHINEYAVERILTRLESTQQIEQQKTHKYRIITIVNWDIYQGNEQQNAQVTHNKRTTDAQLMHTDKKEKKDKNEKNIITKVKYLDAVFLTDEQYKELDSKYGTQTLLDCIEVLNNYKMSSGKKYKSDYHTIQGWVIRRVQDGRGIVGSSGTTTQKKGGAKSDGAEYPIDCEVNG